jgi:hypothetical protein
VKKQLAAAGVELLSAGIDEVPGVYKDIHGVMAAQTDLVEVLGEFRPRIVKMCPGTGGGLKWSAQSSVRNAGTEFSFLKFGGDWSSASNGVNSVVETHKDCRRTFPPMNDQLTKSTVLVLNRNWQAIGVKTPMEAFSMIAGGAATALDIETGGHIRP